MNSEREEIANILLSIEKSYKVFDSSMQGGRKRKYDGDSTDHVHEGCLITNCSEELNDGIYKQQLVREIDGLINEAHQQGLPEVASWFMENREILSSVGTSQTGHNPPVEVRAYEPMNVAAEDNRGDVMKFLYNSGYDISANSNSFLDHPLDTPLVICIKKGNVKLVKWILDQGGKVNLCASYKVFSEGNISTGIYMTPLEIAIADKNLEMAALLRSAGGQVGIVSYRITTSLSSALDHKGYHVALLLSCLEVHCAPRHVVDLKQEEIKKILSYGDNLEKVLCGLYFLNKLLPEYCCYLTDGLNILSRLEKSSSERNAIAILMEELSFPMHYLASHLSEQEETFLTKLETKEVLYKRISNECSKIIHLSEAKLPGELYSAVYSSWKWFTVISPDKDQEFHKICHMLRNSVQAYIETAILNEMDTTTAETLDQDLMGDTPSGGVEETKGNC